MDALLLSRIQFALNIAFHYLFPPMSIGLAWLIVLIEGMYLKTNKKMYKDAAQFWIRIFGLFFAMGVATGFVQMFAFGNNWSRFSEYVGDIFGSMIAAEGLFAFFLEAGFLGIMLLGWGKVKPWLHYLACILVAVGATFSAWWIVMANSWMNTPAGYHIVEAADGSMRPVIHDLFALYFNPSFLTRIGHVLLGSALLPIFFMLSISAYYILKKKHKKFSYFTLRLGLVMAIVVLLLQLWSADSSARGVAKHQPMKLAAMEGLVETTTRAPFTIIGSPSLDGTRMYKLLYIPDLLSILSYHDINAEVKGMDSFEGPKPNVFGVFWTYRLMIYSWGAMLLITIIGLILWRRKKIEEKVWFLWILIGSIFFPYLANITGWFTNEMGRQPWIVQGQLYTKDGNSLNVSAGEILASIIMFSIIYTIILALFLYLLNEKIQNGPVPIEKIKNEDPIYAKGR